MIHPGNYWLITNYWKLPQRDEPTLLPLIVQALAELTKSNPDEESIMKSVYECGGLCSGFVENGLNISQQSTWMEKITRAPFECPFYKEDGIYYLSCDPKKEYPISNNWKMRQISLWVFPLKNTKVEQHKMLSPMSRYITSFWEGVSRTRLGDLLPPYHPVLIIKLYSYPCSFRWIALDCGREGIGIVSAPGGASPPLKELLKEEAENAKCAQKKISYKFFQTTLYDILDYALSHSSPINLKWHLVKHKGDMIGGLTSYCSTTCWGFVTGALNQFTTFTLDPIKVVQELWPEK